MLLEKKYFLILFLKLKVEKIQLNYTSLESHCHFVNIFQILNYVLNYSFVFFLFIELMFFFLWSTFLELNMFSFMCMFINYSKNSIAYPY